MPFTPTHILAVVPIAAVRPGWLPFAALAIGSMVPDLPLFLPGTEGLYGQTHSLPGLLAADLPLGVVGYLAFMALLRRPLAALLPDACQARCVGPLRRGIARTPGDWLRVAVAVLLGAATHLAWDSFTHRGRWGTAMVPWLNDPILTLAGQGIPGYKVFQYGSTALGLPCLTALAVAWIRRQAPESIDESARLARPARAAVLVGLVAVTLGAAAWAGRSPGLTPYERLGRGVTTGGFALGIALLLYATLFEAIGRRAGRRADRG